jgi:hypothetical protein
MINMLQKVLHVVNLRREECLLSTDLTSNINSPAVLFPNNILHSPYLRVGDAGNKSLSGLLGHDAECDEKTSAESLYCNSNVDYKQWGVKGARGIFGNLGYSEQRYPVEREVPCLGFSSSFEPMFHKATFGLPDYVPCMDSGMLTENATRLIYRFISS